MSRACILPEYGIVHCHLESLLQPFLAHLSSLPRDPKLLDFVMTNDGGLLFQCFNRVVLGAPKTEEVANLLHFELLKVLRKTGIEQSPDWQTEPPAKRQNPAYPIVPWLLFRSAELTDSKIGLLLTPSGVARLIATDASLPPWLLDQISPKDCERHVKRLRAALRMVKEERENRFRTAGGMTSPVAVEHPEVAIMYPEATRRLGPHILEPDKVRRIFSRAREIALLRFLAERHGLQLIEKKDRPIKLNLNAIIHSLGAAKKQQNSVKQ
jgi:hypothetical protein